jgi:hypothetical protein
MGYNLEAMERVLEWAEEGGDDDATFDIRYWGTKPGTDGHDCGTTLCLAGKALTDAGIEMLWRNEGSRMVARYVTGGDDSLNVKGSAGQVLGLSVAEAAELFTPELDLGNEDHDEDFALDFLRHLIGRAHEGKRNMSGTEVEKWLERWVEDKKDDLGME